MTITPITPPTIPGVPITGFPLRTDPYTNITPFTYRDGITYMEVLEDLRNYIKNVLVPYVNSNMLALQGAWDSEIETLVNDINTQIANLTEATNTDIANLIDSVNALIPQLNQAIADAQTSATNAAGSATEADNSAVSAANSAASAASDAENAANSANGIVGAVGGISTFKVTQGVDLPALGVYSTFALAAAAMVSGTRVEFSAGTHIIATPIIVTNLNDLDFEFGSAIFDTTAITTATPFVLDKVTNARVHGGRFFGAGGARNTSNNGIAIRACTGIIVDSVTIESVSCMGIVTTNDAGTSSTDVHIRNCIVRNTMADGIHANNGTNHYSVEGCSTVNTGDDCISVVSYVSNGGYSGIACDDFLIVGNTVKNGLARGISVSGGTNGLIEGNRVMGSGAAGIIVQRDSTFNTYGATDIKVIGNHINNPATTVDNGGIHLAGDTTQPTTRVSVENNTIIGSRLWGIYLSSLTSYTTIKGNRIVNAGSIGISATQGDSLTIHDNEVLSPNTQGIQVASTVTGPFSVCGNYIRDANRSNGASVNSIDIHGDAMPVIFAEGNRVVDLVGNTTYSYVFYTCKKVHFAPDNFAESYGIQQNPAFATGAIPVEYFPQMTTVANNALPTSGTYQRGAVIWNNNPLTNGYAGWIVRGAGTFGTLAITGTSAGDTSLVVSDASSLISGQYLTIAGATGSFRIVKINGTTVTLATAVGVAVSAAAVSFTAPVTATIGTALA